MITGGQSGISRQAKRWEEKQIEGIINFRYENNITNITNFY